MLRWYHGRRYFPRISTDVNEEPNPDTSVRSLGTGPLITAYRNEELEEVGVGLELSLTKAMGAPRLMQLGGVNG